MKVTDSKACYEAFSNLCEELRGSDLVGVEEECHNIGCSSAATKLHLES